MASRILKNNTANPVPITDTGYTVPASGQLVIPPQQYGKFEGSSDVVTLIGNGTLTVNDGTWDLSITDGTRLIQGGWTQYISDYLDPTVKAAVTSGQSSSYYDHRVLVENIIAGLDYLGAFRRVNTVVRPDGLTAVAMDGQVEVRSTFGYDQFPDSYFTIVNTGVAGNTLSIYIAGTSVDPTTPDRDVPAYNKTFTIGAGEVGDEISLRNRIVTELNADTTFKSTCYLKAVKCTDRATIQIHSIKFSASNEFYERPAAGSFAVTVTGSTQVVVGFDNLISRSKPVTISKDLDSPHRLGTFGVSGTVSITYKELADLYVQEAQRLGSSDMRVDGSVTNLDFIIAASALTDIYIEDLVFDGQGNGIRFGNFLARAGLTNGILLTIKSDNVITTFPVIYKNEDFKNKFAALSGDGANFRIDVQAGSDEILAILRFANPFVMRAQNTFGSGNDDYIKVTIRDNLTAAGSRFNFRAKGFEKEP